VIEARSQKGLPFILLAAVVQGWLLYGIYHALRDHHWPATDHAWLYSLLAIVIFIPVTVELLSEFAWRLTLWSMVAVLMVCFFYFGWHYGTRIDPQPFGPEPVERDYFSVGLELGVLWLLLLPFAQTRLSSGSWKPGYDVIFSHAWRNKLVLAEAALFTGLFWLLLFLWQTLFHMLGINYFKELFEEPIFIFPVTSLTFGCAVHLVGSVERFTAVVLEQILNVLKWLAAVAGAILVLFSIALILKWPSLVYTGQKAIGVSWLLWLLAVIVLLLNAAYRDGSVSQPYPRWLSLALRCAVPFMIVVALTALYALAVRIGHFGLTVERFWALVVAGMGILYSLGYSSSIVRSSWLGGIAGINVKAALVLIVVLCAALTPLLSPYRLAANSQYKRVELNGLASLANDRSSSWLVSPLTYLRFDSGEYGRDRLKELANRQVGVDADAVRKAANFELQKASRFERDRVLDPAALLTNLRVFPAGRALDKELTQAVLNDLGGPGGVLQLRQTSQDMVGLFVDLNADATDEFVLLTKYSGFVYAHREGGWFRTAAVVNPPASGADFAAKKREDLEKGNFFASRSKWDDLVIGGRTYRIEPQQPR